MIIENKIEKIIKSNVFSFVLLVVDISFVGALAYFSYKVLMDTSSRCFIDYCDTGETFSFLSIIASLLNLAVSLPIIVLSILIIILFIISNKKNIQSKDKLLIKKNISFFTKIKKINIAILLIYLFFYIYYSTQ